MQSAADFNHSDCQWQSHLKSRDVAIPSLNGKMYDYRRKCRKNREIATPVCALARNDMLFFRAALVA